MNQLSTIIKAVFYFKNNKVAGVLVWFGEIRKIPWSECVHGTLLPCLLRRDTLLSGQDSQGPHVFSSFHSFIIVLSLGIYYLYCRVFFSGMLVDSDRMTCIT